MNVVETGHIYDLETKNGEFIRLTYFKNLPNNENGHDGVLCQEVIRSLIDRVFELNKQKPCYESLEIILLLRNALEIFETRAFRNALKKCYSECGKNIEELPIKTNGHIFSLKD